MFPLICTVNFLLFFANKKVASFHLLNVDNVLICKISHRFCRDSSAFTSQSFTQIITHKFIPIKPLSTSLIKIVKYTETICRHRQFAGNSPTNCLIVFDHFVELALKGLIYKLLCIRSKQDDQQWERDSQISNCLV